jgi:hypothetical protein
VATPEAVYRIRSQHDPSGIDQAKAGLRGFEESARSVGRTFELLMGAGALMGISRVFRDVSKAAGDCEAAFLKANPAMNEAEGSAANFAKASDNLKFSLGMLVTEGASPLRGMLTDLINGFADSIKGAKDLKQQADDLAQLRYDIITPEAQKTQDQIKSITDQLNDAKVEVGRLKLSYENYFLNRGVADWQKAIKGTFSEQELADANKLVDELQAKLDALKTSAAVDWGSYQAPGHGRVPMGAGNGEEDFRSAGEIMAMAFMREISGEAAANDLANVLAAQAQLAFTTFGGHTGGIIPEGAGGTIQPGTTMADLMYRGKPGEVTGGAVASMWEGPVKGILDALAPFASSIKSITALMNPWQIVINAALSVIGPAVDKVLSPLIGALVVLGQALGGVVVPVLQFFAPIIEKLAEVFVWIYNNALVPLANAFIGLFVTIKAFGQLLWYIVTLQWGKIGSLNPQAEIQASALQPITLGTVQSAGDTYLASQPGDYTGSKSAEWSRGRQQTFNIYINAQVVAGDAGIRNLALMIRNEIRAAEALGY